MKHIVLPPYNNYDLSTFVISGPIVNIGHFGGFCDKDGNIHKNIEDQVTQGLLNLEEALDTLDLRKENIAKLNVFLKDIKDFKGMHMAWKKFFGQGPYPVRTVLTTDFISEECLVQFEGMAYFE